MLCSIKPLYNLLANFTKEQNELTGFQSLAKRSDTSSIKALIFFEVPTLSLIFSIKDLFIKFMKVFIESIQAWNQKQAELQE